MSQKDLLYMQAAFSYRGVKEITGGKHSPIILTWLQKLKAWWANDEVPWCGVFVGFCMQQAGFTIPKTYYRAKSWLEFGEPSTAKYGAIAVLGRAGGGHVGFVTAVSATGDFKLLGGNQGNQVSEVWFKADRVLGFRAPHGAVLADAKPEAVGKFSKTEA